MVTCVKRKEKITDNNIKWPHTACNPSLEKTLFTLSIHCPAHPTTSEGVPANFGSWGFKRVGFLGTSCMDPMCFCFYVVFLSSKTSPHLLKLLVEYCFAVKLTKCVVDYKPLPDIPSWWELEDNDIIHLQFGGNLSSQYILRVMLLSADLLNDMR